MLLTAFFTSVPGAFGPWSNWSECSATCDGGKIFRYRLCDSPAPSHGGQNCTGDYVQEQECNERPCPGKAFLS